MKRLMVLAAVATAALGLALDSPAQRIRPETAFRPRPLVVSDARTPISLEKAELDVETIGSMARTSLLLTLRNPNERVLEGTLDFPLQPGQQVTGFALDIDGAMRDAVPVPKERGRQVFEDIERRRVDPALLEQVAGNHFRLRVYPIPARGTRQVRLVIDETLRREGDAWQLAVPAQLLAEAPGFALRVRGRTQPQVTGAFSPIRLQRNGDGYAADVPRSAINPAHGLVLRFPAEMTGPRTYAGVQGNDHYVLAELPVGASSKPRVLPHSVGLLWDASASGRTRDHAGELALLDRYFRAMGHGLVFLRLLRDTGQDGGIFEVRGGDWSALRKALTDVVYDGATDLADWAPASGIGDYLLVSDGLGNYGDRPMPQLARDQRLYAIASSSADVARLASLADSRRGRLVAWQGGRGVDAAARALLEDGARVVGLQGEGVAEPVAQSRWIDDGMLRVAARLTAPTGSIRIVLQDAEGERTIAVPVAAADEARVQVPQAWAAWTARQLAEEPELNRAAVTRLGNTFGLVTAGTSLLVLDDPADYVRYDIPAPAALQARVTAFRAERLRAREASRSERLDKVAGDFARRAAWWERVFPKGQPPVEEARQKAAGAVAAAAYARSEAREMSAPPPSPPPVPLMARGAVSSNATLDTVAVAASDAPADASPVEAGRTAVIRLQPWEPDSPYARRLREAPAERLYTLYLDERDSHADSTAFYLDVADLLMQRGQGELGLRVLSNLAELKLENRHVLRVLGYRLMQAKAYPLAVQVFRQVLEMADEEPQSHRDLGLALAAAGDRQEAIRHLYDVVAGAWDARFAEVELVALNELNQVIATSPGPLDTAFIDPRLARNMPLDLRVVLSWDSDNSDMDLWVTDPNGEKCYYAHQLTYQGGLISDDFTGGYGPEEFVLRNAKPGKYRVEAHYFGDRQQIVTGATTLSLRLSTGWGTRRQRDQVVTMRLSGRDESVLVGEFEVK